MVLSRLAFTQLSDFIFQEFFFSNGMKPIYHLFLIEF
nr:MAG TPA: hypothetical protein [Caudoviricetes sp.]